MSKTYKGYELYKMIAEKENEIDIERIEELNYYKNKILEAVKQLEEVRRTSNAKNKR